LNIRETLLRAPLGQGEVRPAAKMAPSRPVESGPARDAAERSLIGLMLRFPAMIERIEPDTEADGLVGPEWTDIFNAIVSEWKERRDVDGATLAAKLSPERAAEVAALTLEGEAVEEAEAAKMLGDVIAHLQRRRLRGLERDLRRAIRIAEEKKDEKTKKERMLEWQEVVRRERQLMRQRSASRNETQ
jgi:replicative DNA helicase